MENKEKGNFGWGILGFFFPLVGLILFLVWRKNKKGNAKASLIGTIIGFCIYIVSIIVLLICNASLLGFSTNSNNVTTKKVDSTKQQVIHDNEETNEITKNKKCKGTAKLSNKYYYTFDIEAHDSDCASITYTLNDDFEIEFENQDAYYDMYINGNNAHYGAYFGSEIALIGNTVITCGGGTVGRCVIDLYNKDGETYSFKQIETDMYAHDYNIKDDGTLVLFADRKVEGETPVPLRIDGEHIETECGIGLSEFLKRNNISGDAAYSVEYTLTLNSNGLYEYNSSKVTQTIKEFYNEYCSTN